MKETNVVATNKVYLTGEIISKPVYSHEMFGEDFYEVYLSVKRLSDQADILLLTVSERLMTEQDLKIGSVVSLHGQFRSYNKLADGKSKLMLTVFVREFLPLEGDANPNSVELQGFICKPPVYRTTPFNREICDVLVAVNRAYNKSDYIPCIAWGRNARFVRYLPVGEFINISGRIQSREYQKKISEEETVTKTAYEVSVSKIVIGTRTCDIDAEVAATEAEYDSCMV